MLSLHPLSERGLTRVKPKENRLKIKLPGQAWASLKDIKQKSIYALMLDETETHFENIGMHTKKKEK